MLESVLREGFALAHRRLGLVFLDTLWKALWLVGTVAALFLIAAWFVGELRSIGWEATEAPGMNGLIVAALLREFWAAYRLQLLSSVLAAVFLSVLCWFALEAYFRRRIVLDLAAALPAAGLFRRSFPGAESGLNVFLVSGAVKSTTLAAVGVLLVPVCLAGATALAVVVFLALAFFLTLTDTLIRSDAVELFATDLIRVTGLIGILLLFESMIGVSLFLIVLAGFLNAARLVDALVMLGAAAVVVTFLNVLHSYLLLVRFSAVGIMRRNVVEV